MQELTSDSLRVAIVLLPGFLSLRIRDFFGPVKPVTALDQFMEALAFSVANFVLYSFVLRAALVRTVGLGYESPLDLLSGLGLSAVFLGLLAGVTVGKDYHYRLARYLRLTARTGRVDVWQDVFEDIRGNWLLVHLDDGQRVMGWARYYSEDGRKPSIFMRQASWVSDDGTLTTVDGEGLLITELARVKFVEFLGKGDTSSGKSEVEEPGAAEGPRA